jgi:hypothetical protein
MTWLGRVHDLVDALPEIHSIDPRDLLDRLSRLSVRGLARMYDPRSQSFPHTLRGGTGHAPPVARGMSVRYTAIAALGLSRADPSARREVLAGQDLPVLVPSILGLSLAGRDPGALALSVWAALEVGARRGDQVLPSEFERLSRGVDRLIEHARTAAPVPTVEHAWTLAALLAAEEARVLADTDRGAEHLAEEVDRAAGRLMAAQAPTGLFPHHLPPDRLGRLRSHVACFADQAYSIQALVRYAVVTGDWGALEAAGRCADRLAALQGDRGQWWWHYDWANGTVVERYPVYSVHQYGLAPMALLELWEAGGVDHRAAVAGGLAWLATHPETSSELISDELGVIWRKVGRRDPSKFVRIARSAASAKGRGADLPWLDVVFPPGSVDRECRPFELGWLLYAWPADTLVTTADGDVPAQLFRRS